MQPFGHEPAQAALAFGRMKIIGAMQGVAGIEGGTLARHHQHRAGAFAYRGAEELHESDPGHLDTGAMQIEFTVDLHLAAGKALGGAAV